MRQTFATVALVAAATLVPAMAHAQAGHRLGEAGESCRARSDCAEGLMCIANTCRDTREGASCGATSECGSHLVCRQNQCVAPAAASTPLTSARVYASAAPSPVAPVVSSELAPAWNHPFEEGSTHFFAGFSLAPGYTGKSVYGYDSGSTAFMFNLRAGVLIGRNEIAFELAPGTFILKDNLGEAKGVATALSYAHFIRVAHNLYWPLRVKVGYAGAIDLKDTFSVGGSLLGLAYTWKHVLFEVAPTSRYVTDFGSLKTYDVLVNLSASYVF
jgi:hypothetical protein